MLFSLQFLFLVAFIVEYASPVTVCSKRFHLERVQIKKTQLIYFIKDILGTTSDIYNAQKICQKQCCQNPSCHLALALGDKCYSLRCRDLAKSNCDTSCPENSTIATNSAFYYTLFEKSGSLMAHASSKILGSKCNTKKSHRTGALINPSCQPIRNGDQQCGNMIDQWKRFGQSQSIRMLPSHIHSPTLVRYENTVKKSYTMGSSCRMSIENLRCFKAIQKCYPYIEVIPCQRSLEDIRRVCGNSFFKTIGVIKKSGKLESPKSFCFNFTSPLKWKKNPKSSSQNATLASSQDNAKKYSDQRLKNVSQKIIPEGWVENNSASQHHNNSLVSQSRIHFINSTNEVLRELQDNLMENASATDSNCEKVCGYRGSCQRGEGSTFTHCVCQWPLFKRNSEPPYTLSAKPCITNGWGVAGSICGTVVLVSCLMSVVWVRLRRANNNRFLAQEKVINHTMKNNQLSRSFSTLSMWSSVKETPKAINNCTNQDVIDKNEGCGEESVLYDRSQMLRSLQNMKHINYKKND